jgi:hypothetical protein
MMSNFDSIRTEWPETYDDGVRAEGHAARRARAHPDVTVA